jgi:hypothetical protein
VAGAAAAAAAESGVGETCRGHHQMNGDHPAHHDNEDGLRIRRAGRDREEAAAGRRRRDEDCLRCRRRRRAFACHARRPHPQLHRRVCGDGDPCLRGLGRGGAYPGRCRGPGRDPYENVRESGYACPACPCSYHHHGVGHDAP